MSSNQKGNVVLWAVFLVVVIGVLVAAIMYGNKQESPASTEATSEQAIELLGLRDNDHIKGNPEAKVVLVEYSDFQCPACKSFVPLGEELVEKYGEDIAFVYRHLPLRQIHPNADIAARAAEAAGQQGAFYAMHDLLFDNQSTWSGERNPRNLFVSYAEELELDLDLFAEDLNNSELDQRVDQDYRDAEIILGGPRNLATPSIFLNGERLQGASLNQIETLIDELIASPVSEEIITESDTATTTE